MLLECILVHCNVISIECSLPLLHCSHPWHLIQSIDLFISCLIEFTESTECVLLALYSVANNYCTWVQKFSMIKLMSGHISRQVNICHFYLSILCIID